MSISIIKVDGFVANEPELRKMPDGITPVLSLSVPHQRSQKNEQSGQWENIGPTTWHTASLFGAQAEAAAPLIVKGTHVLVEGFVEIRTYDKQDGSTGAEIMVRRAKVGIIPRVEKPAQGGGYAAPEAQPAPQADAWATPGMSYGDDTPF